jgi:hypothetical protein
MVENKNFQITVVILIGFCLVFSSLFILQSIIIIPNLESSQKEFFNKKFDEKIQKVVILGSSQTAPLNTKYIIQKISENHDNYTVYNLSIDADNPKKRLSTLQETINLKPSIILYGISLRDFTIEKNSENIFSISQIKNMFDLNFSFNPKLMSLKTIKEIVGNNAEFIEGNDKINQINTPFTELSPRHTIILNENELKKESLREGTIYFDNDDEKINSIKEIIYELKKNNIKTILFAVPLPKSQLDLIPHSEKIEFYSTLNEIANNFDIKFYNYTEKYEKLPIWSDFSHVAFNSNSIIYSDDVSKIIQGEIDS